MSPWSSFHRLAEREIFEAVDYYTTVGGSLAVAFIDEVDRATAFLVEHPEGAPLEGRAVRRLILQRFPYSLLYSIRADEIRILAVAHQKRRPFYWRGRR